jgi:hypothetical protein
MKPSWNSLIFSFLFLLILGCEEQNQQKEQPEKKVLVEMNLAVVEAMRLDGINPVLSTRMFSYPNIAAYEVLSKKYSQLPVLGDKINEWKGVSHQIDPGQINTTLAALSAYHHVARKLTYRESIINSAFQKLASEFAYLPDDIEEASKAVGQLVAGKVLEWAAKDGYKETKGMNYYIVSDDPSSWKPTPPEYRPALEPHWGKLRAFLVDTPAGFTKAPPVPFDTLPNSGFYNLAKEVYESSKSLTEEQHRISIYWDDNPDLNKFKGHAPYPRRHINPAAHWISIISQVIERDSTINLADATRLYTFASVAFFDANLVSWFDKYHYNLIRPVTYIREYIDPSWETTIITPPFPEHTSAHSACSFAVATVLSGLLGDAYLFTDSTHVQMGWGTRSFQSFDEAAWEIAISRFYGGIHYMAACKMGKEQGKEVGQLILAELK